MNSPKIAQRKALHRKREALNVAVVKSASEKICKQLYKYLEQGKYRKIHVYLPIESNKELNTWPFIKKIWQERPEVQISTSIYGESRSLRHVVINPQTTFEEDNIGIPIPTSNYEQSLSEYDLIIVPVLGFDTKLHRLGYGTGAYDTFLEDHPLANKVGLAYETSKLESIKNEAHDIKLDTIITEVQLYD